MEDLLNQIDSLVASAIYKPENVVSCLEKVTNYQVNDDEDLEAILHLMDKVTGYCFDNNDDELFGYAFGISGQLILRAIEEKGLSLNFAEKYAQQLKSSKALSYYKLVGKIISESEHSWPEVQLANLENAIGDLLRQFGDLDVSLRLLLHANKRMTEIQSKQNPLLHSTILNNLGLVYHEAGDFMASIEYLLHSLKLAMENGEKYYQIAITLDNLGSAELNLAKRNGPLHIGNGYVNEQVDSHLNRAEEYVRKAMTYFQQILPDSAQDYVKSLLLAASIAVHRSDLQAEEEYTDRALQMVQETQSEGELFWNVLVFRSNFLLRNHRLEEVIQLLSPVKRDYLRNYANEKLSQVFTNLALAYARVGDNQLAQEVLRLTIGIDRELLKQKLSDSSKTARHIFTSFANRTKQLLGIAVSTLKDQSCPDWVYEVLLNRKGILAERLAYNWHNLKEIQPEQLEALKKLQRTAAQLDLDGADVQFISDARRIREDAERNLRNAEIETFSSLDQDIDIEWISLDQVKQALYENTVLLDITTMRSIDDTGHYLMFYINQRGSVTFHDLGPTDKIDTNIQLLLKEVQAPDDETNGQFQEACRYLSEQFFGDIDLLENVVIIPTSLWYWVPFSMLLDNTGISLMERHNISTLPSSRWLIRNPSLGRTPGRDNCNPPLVLGDPDYDFLDLESVDYLMPLRQTRLFNSAREVEEVASLLGITPLLQRQSTRQILLEAKRPEILHLAAHGSFLTAISSLKEQSEPRVTIMRGEGGVVTTEYLTPGLDPLGIRKVTDQQDADPSKRLHDARVQWLREIGPSEPSSRSVLLLTGFNAWIAGKPTPSDIGSGLLTAREFSQLDLAGTKLVVFSACETGIGPIEEADGSLVGLRTAALFAGAASSLCSLWPVDDAVTVELILQFYQGLKSGQNKSHALRSAQLNIRDRYKDPYYWAGWVIEGNTGSIQFG